MQKRLQIGGFGRLDRTLAFQELGADTGGLDNERTMSDVYRGRTGDEAAIWSSHSSQAPKIRYIPHHHGAGSRRVYMEY
jgi:hypothetical protein